MTSTTTTSPVPDSFLLPSLAVLGGQISVNLGAAMAKQLFPVIGVEGITAYRVGFSALILLAIVRPWRFRLERKDVVNLLIYGSVLGLMNLLIYRAFALIPIGIAVAIEVTGPLAVAMLSSRRPRDLLAVACAVFGLYLLLPLQGGAGSLNPVGVAYALGAALCWALYIIFGKRASTLQGGQAVAWGMTVAAVLMVPLGVSYSGTALLVPSIALMGLAIAMLSSALPYSLEIFALRRLPQGVFGMFSSAAPAISALAAMLVLGEHLSLIQWLAIACIVFASAMAALGAQGAKR
ncbi:MULTISPECIES: EamA family transporter [unclassified Janthinobacterium]|uniref:EamA family transporter n=1 Tax=unclassified Janthinobacterium TaxID=2610881 RepID=UPI00161E697F|nr:MULTISPECIES: EamA family transporter [unclassified Janthinobacterium]MBB5606158.1 inner membrane transporter RhtA [Janthinobacterium sp. S3T4]MBB5611970.1 inner membrane transporter RhtA [Janthinobacterium sp. S3M3]